MCDILETHWPLPCNPELEAQVKLTQAALAAGEAAMAKPPLETIQDEPIPEKLSKNVGIIKEFGE